MTEYLWKCPSCKVINESEIVQSDGKTAVDCECWECGHNLVIKKRTFIHDGEPHDEWYCDDLKGHDYTDKGEMYDCEEVDLMTTDGQKQAFDEIFDEVLRRLEE